MITAIEIENFKGFGARQRIELAPITLLFGANSAGKSSIFHALFYLRELFVGNDPTPGLANYFSDRVDLGGFRNTVHDHDMQQEIKFRIEFEVGDQSRFGREVGDFDLGNGLIAIELTIGAGIDEQATIRRYEVEWSEFTREPKFMPMLSLKTVEEPKRKGFYSVDLTAHVGNLHSWLHIEGEYEQDRYSCQVKMSNGSLPNAPRIIHSLESPDLELSEAINGVLFASREYVKICLEDFYYIGPWREMPNSQHISHASTQRSRWAGGLAAWDMIMDSISNTFPVRLNYWLGRLLGIHIQRERLYPAVQYSDRDYVDRLVVIPTSSCGGEGGRKTRLRVQDVGYGVSQIVPFVAAMVMEEYKTVAIEQPELHLHPKLQAELGDLLISECVSGPLETQAIVETHSQHLILRIKRRIRETMKGTPAEDLSLSPDEVSVNFFRQVSGETDVIPIHLDLNGEFVEPWPDDFFDLDFNERFS